MNLLTLLPEFIVIIAAFLVLLLDMFEKRKFILYVAVSGLALAFINLTQSVQIGADAFSGRILVDSVAWWFKVVFLISAVLMMLMSADSLTKQIKAKEQSLASPGEFISILLFTLAGAMFFVSSTDLISMYVSLEVTTIPLSLLVAWNRNDEKSSEAGIKYILIGAFSSAFLLLGLGYLYGLVGSTQINVIAGALTSANLLTWFIVSLLLISVGFKLALVPFQLYAADVYQGAPIPVTAYLSVASKGIGLALGFHVLYRLFGQMLPSFSVVFAVLAALTMTFGNVVAMTQNNIKRFMAFSSISQAGYFFMAFLTGDNQGISALLFYFLCYAVSNFAAFAVITWFANETGKEDIDSYKGLSITNPLVAMVMLLALLSLAGIPPLAGFVGKFFLFNIAAKAGFNWLVGVAALNSTISLFYYLNISRKMYMEKPDASTENLTVSHSMKLVLLLSVIGILLFGVIPQIYETINSDTANWIITVVGK